MEIARWCESRDGWEWKRTCRFVVAESVARVFEGATYAADLVGFKKKRRAIVRGFQLRYPIGGHGRTTFRKNSSASSGLTCLVHSFDQFADPGLVLAGFATLFVIGAILAYARLRTKSLWLPIGLHGGWIFASIIFNRIAHRERGMFQHQIMTAFAFLIIIKQMLRPVEQ